MTVKVFRSTDFGAPTNTNVAGSLIAILDACLVNGYGEQNVVSITRVDSTATVTLVAAHGLKDGTFVKILGAEQTAYNGDFPITVTGANTFTYQVTGSPATPATGTIIKRVAPAGWTKPFSGTNKAGYRQGVGSNGFYLRVQDTLTTAAKVRGFENMTDVDTGTGHFPTDAQEPSGTYTSFMKSSSATALGWDIIATEKLFFVSINNGSNFQLYYFGDFVSNKAGDAFNTVFRFGTADWNAGSAFDISSNYINESVGLYVPRAHTQIGSSKRLSQLGNSPVSTSMGGGGGIPYPSPIDNALHLSPISLGENPGGIRGRLPGLWHVLHNKPFAHGDIITGTGDFVGKKFIAITGGWSNNNQFLVEISDTW